MATSSITDIPIVKITNPCLHLSRGDSFGQIDHPSQNPGILHAGGPQFQGQLVVFSDPTRQEIHLWLRHAVHNLGADPESGHAIDVSLLSQSPQFVQSPGATPSARPFSLDELAVRTCCPNRVEFGPDLL